MPTDDAATLPPDYAAQIQALFLPLVPYLERNDQAGFRAALGDLFDHMDPDGQIAPAHRAELFDVMCRIGEAAQPAAGPHRDAVLGGLLVELETLAQAIAGQAGVVGLHTGVAVGHDHARRRAAKTSS